MSLWGALLGGCHFILHAAGWLEGGLTASFEKFILDVEMLQMFAELFQPVLASAEEIGIEAVAEVGPGGHFFAAAPHHAALPATPSTRPWCRTGAITAPGRMMARRPRPSARARAGAKLSRPLSRRPWTRPCAKR